MNRRFLAFCVLCLLAACARETVQTSEATSPPPATPVATNTAVAHATDPASASGPCAFITEADATTIMGHGMKFGQGTQP
jgi:hypothetical protein